MWSVAIQFPISTAYSFKIKSIYFFVHKMIPVLVEERERKAHKEAEGQQRGYQGRQALLPDLTAVCACKRGNGGSYSPALILTPKGYVLIIA